MAQYPPPYMADLAVYLLAGRGGNDFSPEVALRDAVRGTRGVVPSTGCCMVSSTDTEGERAENDPYYFGIDKDGYVVVNARTVIPGWPLHKGRFMPIRLTRWLLEAQPGAVVRHTCDTPSCVRVSHLRVGSTQENVGDALRRVRRPQNMRTESMSSPSPSGTRRRPTGLAAEAPSSRPAAASATPEGTYASPSKLARKRARAAASASEGGRTARCDCSGRSNG